MKKKIKLSKKLLGAAALTIGLGTAMSANAINAPQVTVNTDTVFSMTEIPSQPTMLSNDDHKCGEGKCGEHECGEHECGEDDDKKSE